ncbi:MAG: DUF4157 domain-containing protein [Deltaproteobacteria bacterium]|nr:DUF4157 domain-containing protein [Deltaproteobacteria bacterium]
MAKTSSAVARIVSRSKGAGLQRKAMPGGGEVFTGEVASRTLDVLGARAMTVDKSIIVSEDFDPSKPEDQALFAHEQYHVENSGGEGEHSGYDGEEQAARMVERMVLHRARAGGAEMHEASHTSAPGGAVSGSHGAGHERDSSTESQGEAERGYMAMRAQGLSHSEIVNRIAQEAIKALDSGRDQRNERFGDKKGFL